jgi:hypothetical protein
MTNENDAACRPEAHAREAIESCPRWEEQDTGVYSSDALRAEFLAHLYPDRHAAPRRSQGWSSSSTKH